MLLVISFALSILGFGIAMIFWVMASAISSQFIQPTIAGIRASIYLVVFSSFMNSTILYVLTAYGYQLSLSTFSAIVMVGAMATVAGARYDSKRR